MTVAGLAGDRTRGAHGIKIKTEILLDDLGFGPDMVLLPGGLPGSTNPVEDRGVIELFERQRRVGRRRRIGFAAFRARGAG